MLYQKPIITITECLVACSKFFNTYCMHRCYNKSKSSPRFSKPPPLRCREWYDPTDASTLASSRLSSSTSTSMLTSINPPLLLLLPVWWLELFQLPWWLPPFQFWLLCPPEPLVAVVVWVWADSFEYTSCCVWLRLPDCDAVFTPYWLFQVSDDWLSMPSFWLCELELVWLYVAGCHVSAEASGTTPTANNVVALATPTDSFFSILIIKVSPSLLRQFWNEPPIHTRRSQYYTL